MYRQYFYYEYKKALIHYSVVGNGSKVLFCFHGFGQSNEFFKSLENALGEEYTIYSFDLFYHGKSFWHEREKPISKEFWSDLVSSFLTEKGVGRFSVLGFSMGGKFALATLEYFYPQVEKIILIAPDGVKTSFWYSLATYPSMFRAVFRNMVFKPSYFFNLVKLLNRFRIVDKGVLRFASTQMTTREQRRRVYYSWVVFRELKFDMGKIAFILNENNIKLDMFLGEYDKIVTQKNMLLLLNKVKEHSLTILKTGHSHLIEAVADFLANKK